MIKLNIQDTDSRNLVIFYNTSQCVSVPVKELLFLRRIIPDIHIIYSKVRIYKMTIL